MPHLEKLYEELKDKGLEMIAVNGTDSADVINKYRTESKFTFRIAMADKKEGAIYDIGKHYGIQAYPTNYVVSGDGNVIWRGVGFDEQAIRKALAKLDVK